MNDSAHSLSARSAELRRIAASQHIDTHSMHKIDGESVSFCHIIQSSQIFTATSGVRQEFSRPLCKMP